jgi:hypothetical protein
MNKDDIALVIEEIRYSLSAYYGTYHPFQRLAAELFRISESGDRELAHLPRRGGAQKDRDRGGAGTCNLTSLRCPCRQESN